MRLEKLFLTVAFVSLLLALPISYALQHRSHELKIEKDQSHSLQIKLNSTQKQLEQKNKANQDLQKQLQSKSNSKVSEPLAQAVIEPPVAVSKMGADCEQYRSLISQYGWNVDIAMAVMQAESGCNPNALSPTHDSGLFQLHQIPVYDPAENVSIAYNQKYLTQGWGAWSVCNNGIVACYN